MTNSIKIGKTIYKILSNDELLQEYVGNKIYPLVADNSTTYPFIIFWRDTISSNQCKDTYHSDNITFTILSVHKNYTENLEIANRIRELFEKMKIKDDDIYIYNCKLIAVEENWQENAYIQALQFSCVME